MATGTLLTAILTVHFDDQTPPVLTCPAGQAVVLDADCKRPICRTIQLALQPITAVLRRPRARWPVLEFTGDQVVIVTLTANDGNGNSVNRNFNVHFDDQTPPVLGSPWKSAVVALDPDSQGRYAKLYRRRCNR
ncbi:MAG: hypothetical protein MZV63_56080 [Marinilabiliales bacterium]|nr:hypothetical protein [Marinilabiliales bacterium]